MRKNLHIDLSAHFGAGQQGSARPVPLPVYGRRIWRTMPGADRAVRQEFDGRQGFVYTYEVCLSETVALPLLLIQPDLHVLYLVEGTQSLLLCYTDGTLICDVPPQRARYLYLPAGAYSLCIPEGQSVVFGFYFDGGIFRDGNERPYAFLTELIGAYRSRSRIELASVDFAVGPRTLAHIQYLFDNLHRGHLDNEAFLQHCLIRLIELSREKVLAEYESYSSATVWLAKAQTMIMSSIEQRGQDFNLQEIADTLGISMMHLNRVFRISLDMTALQWKQRQLLERIEQLLDQGLGISEVGFLCAFSSTGAFCRFYRTHRGLTPRQYQRR